MFEHATLGEILSAIGMIAGLFIFILKVHTGMIENRAEVKLIRTQLDMIWDTFFRNGKLEIVNKKMGRANSPVRLYDEVIGMFDSMAEELHALYRQFSNDNADIKLVSPAKFERCLYTEVAKRFGDRITKEIATREDLNISYVAGVLIAMEVARCSPTISHDGTIHNQPGVN